MDDIEPCWVFLPSKKCKYVTVKQDETCGAFKPCTYFCKIKLGETQCQINVLLEGYISQLKLEGSHWLPYFNQILAVVLEGLNHEGIGSAGVKKIVQYRAY
ncbi:hypothetical protein C5167_017636 [Papaver somniferum]|uniref:Uncharacterized protein n=1 Tax=Papaver somniferum TaxID=3469 RepID=A0A4Y7INZ5_PAPSO|nr:hypothetical protein C5167_017636 [Papaver somniferum]